MTPASDVTASGLDGGRVLVRALYDAAIRRVDPAVAVAGAIRDEGDVLRIGEWSGAVDGRVVVVGMGKAAAPMALAADHALGRRDFHGVVVTKDGHRDGVVDGRVTILEASHPLPDERSLAAGERLLATVAGAGPGDLVLALVSGGGSALAEALVPPLTLADLRATTDALLRAGASIGELNAVRRGLSRLKAGGLLAASGAPVHALVLSDVIGNDLGTIASGAVIPGPPAADRAAAALRVIHARGLADRVPAIVLETLGAIGHPGDASSVDGPVGPHVTLVGDNAAAVEAAVALAEAGGSRVMTPAAWQGGEGEASDLGRAFVDDLAGVPVGIDVVLGGGEATVTVSGDGDGGRNTEFALAAAMRLADAGPDGWLVASLATDGQDANTGAAGAIVDSGSVARAVSAGYDAAACLQRNDSLPWCRAAGGLVVTGPSGTNVNDLYIAVRVPARVAG